MEKNKGLWILAIYFFLSVYLLPMFPHGGSAGELTHWATAASLVEKGSFDIAWTEPLIGADVDAAVIGERRYSNKPPGTALLAAPFYALTRVLAGAPDPSNIRITWLVMRFFLATLPLLLLGLWLYQREADELSLAALLFATPLFPYSLLFFPHVLVAVLLYFAFRLLYDTQRIFLRNCLLAGFMSGLAVFCEFHALVPVLVFGAGLFFSDRRDRWSNLFAFGFGVSAFIVLLLLYNYFIFGSPFAFYYAYETLPDWTEAAGQSFSEFGLPTFANLYTLLFSPARGLFFYAPLLLLPVFAFFSSRERKSRRHRVKIAAVAVSILFLAGHGAAHGGPSAGPRYLIMILPLLLDSFFDGEIYGFSNVWQGILFVVSVLLCVTPVLTFPFAPPEFKYPHNNFWGQLLFAETWYAPNLANVAGLSSSFWTVLPLAASVLFILFLTWRYARRPSRFAVGALIGIALVGIYLALPGLDDAEHGFRRATVAERFFMPAGRLENFRASGDPRLLPRVSEAEWRIAETRAQAPNDFPYLEKRELALSPAARLRAAAELQSQGKSGEAEEILRRGATDFPFARCEFVAELALVYDAQGKKEPALRELESVQNLVGKTSRPECQRSQFTLGSLYRESDLPEKSEQTFLLFLANTENSADPQIKALRSSLGAN